MNPTFTWVQCLFHWNRLTLILWMNFGTVLAHFCLGFIIGGVAVSIRAYKNAPAVTADLVFLATCYEFYLGYRAYCYVRRIGPNLKESAKHFERREPLNLSTDVSLHLTRRRIIRPVLSLVGSLGIAVFVEFALINTGVLMVLWDLVIIFNIVCSVTEAHLWDVDDIQPRNRLSLFDPMRQES